MSASEVNAPVLACAGVTKTTRTGVPILRGVDLDVAPGRAVALVGANGSGKTTLLDIVLGLTRATSGRVSIAGRSPGEAVRAGVVGGMLQTGGLLPELTVGETLRVLASLHHVDADPARHGLGHLARRRVAACSGGEQQWIKWVIAQLASPSLLVLDEPTAGMDWAARSRFWAQVGQRRAAGASVLYASHYADEIEGIADDVVVLDAGRVVARVTPQDAAAAAPACGDGPRLFRGIEALIAGRNA